MNRFGTGNTPRTLAILAAVVAVLLAAAVWMAYDRGRQADAAKPKPAAGSGGTADSAAGANAPGVDPIGSSPAAPAAPTPPAAKTTTAPAAPGAGPPDGGASNGGGAGRAGGDGGDGRCPSVTVIAARGTGEPAGTGFLLGQVARQIDAKVSAPVTIVGLNYPATANFAASSRQGVAELRRLVGTERAGACLVLLGYSQGAIVVGDTLAALGAADAAKIRAVAMFGDPRFNSAEPYNVGSFAKNSAGVNRRPTGQLSRFAARIQNYCNGGDTVCQGSGARGSGGHLDYSTFAGQAAGFAAARI
jgi:cutinase